MFRKNISVFFVFLFFLIIFISLILNSEKTFYGSVNNNSEFLENAYFHYNENSIFSWPIFGYYNISSYFGYRTSPTSGASSYHSGIDIPAPENSNIYSICNGIISFIGFYGADGYSIIIENQEKNLQIIYGHVSPDYIVFENQIIRETEKIGTVGPKYIESFENTLYFDSVTGQKTNGATTGCHLHLSIKKDGQAVNPLDYL